MANSWTSNWRKNSSGATPYQIAQMAEKGRAPSFDESGKVRGFRSRPGAPQAANDRMVGLGIAGDVGTAEHSFAWDSFFGKQKPASLLTPATPAQPSASPGMMSYADAAFGTQPGAPAVDPVTSSIQDNQQWLKASGITPIAPQPATPIQGARNGWVSTGAEDVNRIAAQYSTGKPTAKWGAPLPLI